MGSNSAVANWLVSPGWAKHVSINSRYLAEQNPSGRWGQLDKTKTGMRPKKKKKQTNRVKRWCVRRRSEMYKWAKQNCTKARQWLSDSASRTHKFTITLTSDGDMWIARRRPFAFFRLQSDFFPWFSHTRVQRTKKQIVEQKIIIIMCRSDEIKRKKKTKRNLNGKIEREKLVIHNVIQLLLLLRNKTSRPIWRERALSSDVQSGGASAFFFFFFLSHNN